MRVDELHSLASCYKAYDPEASISILSESNINKHHIPDFDDDWSEDLEMWSDDWDLVRYEEEIKELFKSDDDGLRIRLRDGYSAVCRVGETHYMNEISCEYKVY